MVHPTVVLLSRAQVVFLEAAAPVAGEPDTFDVWFGGSDAVVGTARVKVVKL